MTFEIVFIIAESFYFVGERKKQFKLFSLEIHLGKLIKRNMQISAKPFHQIPLRKCAGVFQNPKLLSFPLPVINREISYSSSVNRAKLKKLHLNDVRVSKENHKTNSELR